MKNNSLTLTIVIPVFNEQDHINACLKAIEGQTVMPDRVIVVDNNSTDRTADIAMGFDFVTVVHESRQGVVFARNAGFDAAVSILIGRIDADTIIPADWVENVKDIYLEADQPDLFAVTAPSSFRNIFSGICYALHRLTYFWPSRLLLGHITLVGSNMFITNKLWQAVRSEVCCRTDIHEDMDLAYHSAKAKARLEFSTSLKGSVVARKMMSRFFEYPRMMWRIKTVSH